MLGNRDHIHRLVCAVVILAGLSDAGSVLKGRRPGHEMKLFGFNALPVLTRPLTGPGAADKPAIEPESVTFTARQGSTLHLLNSQRESIHYISLQVNGAHAGGLRTLHHRVFEIKLRVALTQRHLLLNRPIHWEPELDTNTAIATFPQPTPIRVQTGFILDPTSPVRLPVHPCFLFISGICGRTKLHIPRTNPDAIASIIEALINDATTVVAEGTSSFFIGPHRPDALTWRGFLSAWRGFAYTMVVLYHRLGKLALLRALGEPPGLQVVRNEKVGQWERQVFVQTAVLWNWGGQVRKWLERLNTVHERVEGEVEEVDWDPISRASGKTTREERDMLWGLWDTKSRTDYWKDAVVRPRRGPGRPKAYKKEVHDRRFKPV